VATTLKEELGIAEVADEACLKLLSAGLILGICLERAISLGIVSGASEGRIKANLEMMIMKKVGKPVPGAGDGFTPRQLQGLLNFVGKYQREFFNATGVS